MLHGKFRLLALVAVFALVTAACGDSGSLDTEAPAAAPSGGTADTTAATSDTPPATEAPATSDNAIPVTIGNIPGLSDDCLALANVFLSFSGVFSGGAVPDVDLGAIGDLPGDLQDDAAQMIAGLQAYADGVAELGIDFSDPASFANLTEDQQQAFGDLADSIDTDEFNDAADRLSAFGETECSEFTG